MLRGCRRKGTALSSWDLPHGSESAMSITSKWQEGRKCHYVCTFLISPPRRCECSNLSSAHWTHSKNFEITLWNPWPSHGVFNHPESDVVQAGTNEHEKTEVIQPTTYRGFLSRAPTSAPSTRSRGPYLHLHRTCSHLCRSYLTFPKCLRCFCFNSLWTLDQRCRLFTIFCQDVSTLTYTVP